MGTAFVLAPALLTGPRAVGGGRGGAVPSRAPRKTPQSRNSIIIIIIVIIAWKGIQKIQGPLGKERECTTPQKLTTVPDDAR